MQLVKSIINQNDGTLTHCDTAHTTDCNIIVLSTMRN